MRFILEVSSSELMPSYFGKGVSFWIQLPYLEVHVWYFVFHPYSFTNNCDSGILKVDHFGSIFNYDDLVGLSV